MFKQSKDASWGSFHELWMTLGYLFCCCWSVIKLCLTLCDPMAHQHSLSFTISQSLLKSMSTESVMLFNHFVFCCLLLYPSVFPSIKVFSNELALCIRWPKYWSFSISSSIWVDFLWDWLGWSPCCPSDSQESIGFTKRMNSVESILLL